MSYYSSENSDSESERQNDTSLDLSYQMLDTESVGYHLRNCIKEIEGHNTNSQVSKKSLDKGANNFDDDKEEVEVNLYENDNLKDNSIKKIYLQNNMIINVPFEILFYKNLSHLDISSNNISHINDYILHIPHLQVLYLKNNGLQDDSLPKDMSSMVHLREINISGNRFTRLPEQFYAFRNLKYLYAGSNAITEIPAGIKDLKNLQVLHLGGNSLSLVPDELGELHMLSALILCDNQLKKLPRIISQLKKLKSLLLHRNKLCCLPVEIVKLRGLMELSLRDNPLVTNFVNSCARDLMYSSPSLKELAARTIRLHKIKYGPYDLPGTLLQYLKSGHQCVNPNCQGMFFTSCVEHIKFVDFCGMYRVPLMHYLCSSRCTSQTPSRYQSSSSDSEEDTPSMRMKKVLLG